MPNGFLNMSGFSILNTKNNRTEQIKTVQIKIEVQIQVPNLNQQHHFASSTSSKNDNPT